MIFFYLLVAIMPLSDHHFWGGGQAQGEMTMFKLLGGVCLIYAMFYGIVRRKATAFFSTWQSRFFVLFYVMLTIWYFVESKRFALDYSPFLSFTSFLFLFVTTLILIDSRARLRRSLLLLIGATAFASLYVIRQWQQYHLVYAGFRPGGVSGDSNYFALLALVGLPLAFSLMLGEKSPWIRLYCGGCLSVTVLAF